MKKMLMVLLALLGGLAWASGGPVDQPDPKQETVKASVQWVFKYPETPEMIAEVDVYIARECKKMSAENLRAFRPGLIMLKRAGVVHTLIKEPDHYWPMIQLMWQLMGGGIETYVNIPICDHVCQPGTICDHECGSSVQPCSHQCKSETVVVPAPQVTTTVLPPINIIITGGTGAVQQTGLRVIGMRSVGPSGIEHSSMTIGSLAYVPTPKRGPQGPPGPPGPPSDDTCGPGEPNPPPPSDDYQDPVDGDPDDCIGGGDPTDGAGTIPDTVDGNHGENPQEPNGPPPQDDGGATGGPNQPPANY